MQSLKVKLDVLFEITRVQDKATLDHDGLYLVVIKKQQECLNI